MPKQHIEISNRAKMSAIAIGIALLTFLISYGFIYKSYQRRNGDLIKRIEEEKLNQVIRRKITKLYDIRKEFHKYLYDREEPDNFRNILSSMARDLSIGIISMQSYKAERIGRYSKVSLNLRVKCGYDKIGKFIEKIETSPALTIIEKLTLTSASQDFAAQKDRDAEADISILVNAYCIAG